MKKLLCVAVLFFSIDCAFATGEKELFTYSKEKIESSFEDIDLIEKAIIANPSISAEELKALYPQALDEINALEKQDLAAGSGWEIDWGSVAIGAAGCVVIEVVGCLIFSYSLSGMYY